MLGFADSVPIGEEHLWSACLIASSGSSGVPVRIVPSAVQISVPTLKAAAFCRPGVREVHRCERDCDAREVLVLRESQQALRRRRRSGFSST